MHAEQSQRLLAVEIAVGDADAVVGHVQADAVIVHRELHVDARRARMPRHVGEDLLEDAEHRRRHVDVELDALGRQLGAAADAGALLEFLRLPCHRGDEAHVVQHFGPQSGGDLAHRLHRGVDQLAHRVGLLDQRLLAQPLGEPRDFHLQAGEHLAQLVVYLARNVGTLLFPHRDQVRRQAA